MTTTHPRGQHLFSPIVVDVFIGSNQSLAVTLLSHLYQKFYFTCSLIQLDMLVRCCSNAGT